MPRSFGVERAPAGSEQAPARSAASAATPAAHILALHAAGNRAVAVLAREAGKQGEKKAPDAPSGPHVVAKELGGTIPVLSYSFAQTGPAVGSVGRSGNRSEKKPPVEMTFTTRMRESDRIVRVAHDGTVIPALDVFTPSGVLHLTGVYISTFSTSATGDEPTISWTVIADAMEHERPPHDDRRSEDPRS